jgi:hypothetical protein
MKEIKQMLS